MKRKNRDNHTKTKKIPQLLIKLVACLLVTIFALGIIVPVVASATPAPSMGDNNTQLPQNPMSEVVNETESGNELSAPDMSMPTKLLPEGLEYKKDGDIWTIQKVKDNTNCAVIVDGLPMEGFDCSYLTLFIGNVETHEVTPIEVMDNYNYAKVLNLEPGYYVIFANNYAFCDSKGNAYAIEGGNLRYFYYGNDYDDSKFSVKFEDGNKDILHINLEVAPEGYNKIEYNQRVTVTEADLSYPENANIGAIKDIDTDNKKTENNESSNLKDNSKDKEDKEYKKDNEKESNSIWDNLKESFSRSFLIIVGIIICFVGMTAIKNKKKASLEEQTENDKKDDGHIA